MYPDPHHTDPLPPSVTDISSIYIFSQDTGIIFDVLMSSFKQLVFSHASVDGTCFELYKTKSNLLPITKVSL